LTFLSDAAGPTTFPAISGLSTWTTYLTQATNGGGKWCNKTTGALNPVSIGGAGYPDNTIAFYDGGLGLHRVATYLKDAGWGLCATNLQQQASFGNANSLGAIIPNYGSLAGYNIFPRGFQLMAGEDPRYIATEEYLAGMQKGIWGSSQNGAPYGVFGCNPLDGLVREDAYGLDVTLAIDDLGLTPSDTYWTGNAVSENTWKNKRQRCVDELIGMLDAYTNGTGRYITEQYFMTGIAMDDLIHWWQRTKDPRVPIVMKANLDKYYADYNATTHIVMWWPDPNGIHCRDTANWYAAAVTSACHSTASVVNNDLINLLSHAFAWYWRVSGDDTYRIEGDEVFSHQFDNSSFSFLGKSWSQAYRYSFNYVGWRQGWLSPEKSSE
jgi:hypothetical protein